MGELALPITKSDVTPTPPPPPPPPMPTPPPSHIAPPLLPPMKGGSLISTNTWIAIFSYIVSLPLLCYGIWLLFTKDYDCQDSLQMPHMREIIGIGLIIAFAISCFVTHYEAKVVLPGALTLAVALLVMLTFGILLIGSYSMESRGVPASPLWVKARIGKSETWASVKSCIYQSKDCPDLAYSTIELNSEDFNRKKLSAIEHGCCKPPRVCGMEYVNATYWKRMKEDVSQSNATSSGPVIPPPVTNLPSPYPATNNSTIIPSTYGDCQAWSNEITQLCYDCQSCKEAFISTVHRKWWSHGFFLIFMSVVLLLVHTPRFILTMIQRNKS